MAVALLERNTEVIEKTKEERVNNTRSTYSAEKISDEEHNAQISENYKRLITPNSKVDYILNRKQEEPVQTRKELFADRAVARKPYLVENARADSELFRADNPINRKLLGMKPVEAVAEVEEESEDLRPTQTTIQYKTADVKKAAEDSKLSSVNAEKHTSLSKKEKIIIAVVVSVIIAMFALIIINSAILSGINTEMNALESSLTTVKDTYATVSEEVGNAVTDAIENAEKLAESLGLVK
ncbi:MAG: hypothetical protein K2K80_02730 [Clostridia bacterium]|nr:hypothetical protein [Clostridia bacterium]